MTPKACFRLKDVVFSYDDRIALRVPELEILEGEILTLIGPNGSGKTTLLKILNDLLRPTSGSALFFDTPTAGNSALRSRSVYVHQSPFLLAGTVYRNVAFGLKVRHMPVNKIRPRVEESLRLLGLEGFEKRDAKRLSGGETQRVAIARALALRPEFLFLDEPTAQADEASSEKIRSVLSRLSSEAGVTVVLSSHDATLAHALGDRIAFLEDGLVAGIENPLNPQAPTPWNTSLLGDLHHDPSG